MGQKSPFPYSPEQRQGYMDFFSEDHRNHEPLVLEDGTSVAFPAGWTDEDADKWRKGVELQAPSGVQAATYDLSRLAPLDF
jgi:hypothetical protein